VNNNVMILEGTIHNKNIKIILTYMDYFKGKQGAEYEENRNIQREIEKQMEIEPDKYVLYLGDLKGRLKVVEPHIETDCNGKMAEEWTEKLGMHHLNQSDKCTGTYTYGEGGRSAVDHIIVNGEV